MNPKTLLSLPSHLLSPLSVLNLLKIYTETTKVFLRLNTNKSHKKTVLSLYNIVKKICYKNI